MDNIGGYLGNATDGIGQGLAFVLPQDKTEAYAMQLAQQHAKDMRDGVIAAQQQQAKDEAAYQAQFAAQKLPELLGPSSKLVSDNYNKYLQDAAASHAKTGKNPFNDPAFMQQHNTNVMLPAAQSKQLGLDATRLSGLIAADHDNKFTQESKDQVASELLDATKNPNNWLGKPFSQLQGTPSGIDEFNKTIKPISITNGNGTLTTTVPDTSKMKEQAYINSNDPKWNNLKKSQYGIDPNIGDIGSVYNKDGKRIWYTNPITVGHIADEMLANPTEPRNAELFQKAGIVDTDPYAKEKLQALITKQNSGYGKFISDAGNYGNSLVSSKRDISPDTFYEHEAWLRAHPAKPPVDNSAIPSYNVPGNVSQPHTNGTVQLGAATAPVEIDAGDIKGSVVPDKVYDTETGYLTRNTDARNIKNAKIRLLPVSSSTGNLLNDDQLKQAQNGTLKIHGETVPYSDVKYQYMVYGLEQRKVPIMKIKDGNKVEEKDGNGNIKFETIQAPVAFSAKNLNDDKFNKKVDYDKIEANLPQEVRDRIDRQRVVPTASNKSPQAGKTATMQQINSKVGTKGFEGYTASELVDYYKLQGYTIK